MKDTDIPSIRLLPQDDIFHFQYFTHCTDVICLNGDLIFFVRLLIYYCSSSLPSLLIFEAEHDKTNKMTCASSEDSDQPVHPPSLIGTFAVRMKIHWVLILWSDWASRLIRVFSVRFMGSEGPKRSYCGLRRLWSAWYCWFCRAPALTFASYINRSVVMYRNSFYHFGWQVFDDQCHTVIIYWMQYNAKWTERKPKQAFATGNCTC